MWEKSQKQMTEAKKKWRVCTQGILGKCRERFFQRVKSQVRNGCGMWVGEEEWVLDGFLQNPQEMYRLAEFCEIGVHKIRRRDSIDPVYYLITINSLVFCFKPIGSVHRKEKNEPFFVSSSQWWMNDVHKTQFSSAKKLISFFHSSQHFLSIWLLHRVSWSRGRISGLWFRRWRALNCKISSYRLALLNSGQLVWFYSKIPMLKSIQYPFYIHSHNQCWQFSHKSSILVQSRGWPCLAAAPGRIT